MHKNRACPLGSRPRCSTRCAKGQRHQQLGGRCGRPGRDDQLCLAGWREAQPRRSHPRHRPPGHARRVHRPRLHHQDHLRGHQLNQPHAPASWAAVDSNSTLKSSIQCVTNVCSLSCEPCYFCARPHVRCTNDSTWCALGQ